MATDKLPATLKRIKGGVLNVDDLFSSDAFSVCGVIDKWTDLALKGAKRDDDPKAQITTLLHFFEKLDSQLAELSAQVDAHNASLQDGFAADQAAYVHSITAAEREIATLRSSMQELDAHADHLTAFAGRVGARLQTVDSQKRRALKAARMLQFLHAFSRSEDLSTLPGVFQDDSRMEEAARLAAQLSALISRARSGQGGDDAHSGSNEGNGNGGNGMPAYWGSPPAGTLPAAAEQLELYRNVLDNRVVSRFDAAAKSQDFAGMAACARVMAASSPQGDSLLISRYISTRPLFMPQSQSSVGSPPPGAPRGAASPVARGGAEVLSSPPSSVDSAQLQATTVDAIRALFTLFPTLSSSLRDEAVVMEQVFVGPRAGAALTQRLFDEIVQPALESALVAPPLGGGFETLRAYLRLLVEAYRKTLALAEEAVALAGPGSGLEAVALVDGAFGIAASCYLPLEQSWLGSFGSSKLGTAKGSLSLDLVLDLLAMNEEAVRRCVAIMPPTAVATSVAQLFHHTDTDVETSPEGCLLGQVAAHIFWGLSGSADRCVRRLAGAFRPMAGADRDSEARLEAAASLGTLLRSISQVAEMCTQLKRHYDRVIAPNLTPAPVEAAACLEGLAQLVAAVDARTSTALGKTVAQIARKVTATLAAEQTKADFRPPAADHSGGAAIHSPTYAAVLVVSLLRALGEQAATNLHGSNIAAFVSALALRTAAAAEAHALKFTFSPEGALRWRRDVAELSACMVSLGARAAAPAFEDLYAMAALLIVPPDSLPGMLDGLGHLGKARLRAVLERREDYRGARVGGKPLSALLAPAKPG